MPEWFLCEVLHSLGELCWNLHGWRSSMYWLQVWSSKRIKDKAPNAEWLHCFLHREALAAKKLSQELHKVLNSIVKCVNLIKARPLNQCLFPSSCTDMDSDHQALLLHKEVWWLSQGCALKCVCDLWEEIAIFLRQHNYVALAGKFSQIGLNAKVADLANIFDSLNCPSVSTQNTGFTVIDNAAKFVAQKLILWKSYVTWDQYNVFPELTNYINDKEVDIKQTIIRHLEQLAQKFGDY